MFISVSGLNLRRRLIQLVIGLILFGVGIALMLQSDLGLPPWDVLHQGLAEQFGLTVGIWSIIISVVVLLAWLPLRERYGLGTILNAVIIGVVIDLGPGHPRARVTGHRHRPIGGWDPADRHCFGDVHRCQSRSRAS